MHPNDDTLNSNCDDMVLDVSEAYDLPLQMFDGINAVTDNRMAEFTFKFPRQ